MDDVLYIPILGGVIIPAFMLLLERRRHRIARSGAQSDRFPEGWSCKNRRWDRHEFRSDPKNELYCQE